MLSEGLSILTLGTVLESFLQVYSNTPVSSRGGTRPLPLFRGLRSRCHNSHCTINQCVFCLKLDEGLLKKRNMIGFLHNSTSSFSSRSFIAMSLPHLKIYQLPVLITHYILLFIEGARQCFEICLSSLNIRNLYSRAGYNHLP